MVTSRMERTGGGETPEGGSLWKTVGKVSRMLRFRSRHSKGMLGNGVFRSCEVRQNSSNFVRSASAPLYDEKMNGGGSLSADRGGQDGTGTETGTGGGPVKLRLPQQTQELPLRSSDPLRSKVYLESRLRSPGSVRMLTDEVSQIQEVRYCLKTLREQMAARQNNNNNNNKFPANVLRLTPGDPPAAPDSLDSNVSVGDDQQESSRLREVTRRLYARLKEAESRHQEEKDRLQAESSELRDLLAERSERLQKAEQTSREKQQRVEELQTLLHSTQQESSHLKDKVAEKEAELLKLKTSEEEQRCAELEKELSVLKEKNHHLDDMLKSHQRKVRSMIEQVQNSKMLLQDRDQVIRDLEERVAFLDAENRELHDHMDFFLNGHEAPPSSDGKPDVVYSKPLTPTAHGSKPLPYIKVIEIQP
uniref:Tuftelin-like n=1 Tax=Oryzias melastigma TaxID=30732 RepID=A0A3B3D4P2_ORYME